MRELNLQEAGLVAGGNGILADRAEGARPQPDGRNLTVSYQPFESTVTVTAKCVDYRRGLDPAGSEPVL